VISFDLNFIQKGILMRLIGAAVVFVAWFGCALAEEIADPPVFSAAKKAALEILLVAREQKLTVLQGSPVGWVYEACFQKDAGKYARRCPGPGVTDDNRKTCPTAGDAAVSPYGGVRLQLERTQRLRIRLVNCLPAVMKDVPDPGDFKHVGENGDTLLQYDPTNLHTHGLIVEPRRADSPGDSYGDYMFVLGINPANNPPRDLAHRAGELPDGMPMDHGGGDHAGHYDITPDGVIDYDIDLINHPEGLFWFHPHAHGLALNQVTAGLAGVITVGGISQYHCGTKPCDADRIKVRHLLFKDTQLRIDGTLKLQEDTQFCGNLDASSTQLLGEGFCPGGMPTENGQPVDYRGGKWYFTVNGQPDPTVTVNSSGEVWRIANTSGSATYVIGLQDKATGENLQVQVLAIDGVSTDVSPQTTTSSLETLFAGKLRVAECAKSAGTPTARPHSKPVCADRIRMMPSSRVDLWIQSNVLVPKSNSASLRTYNFSTGLDGDTWPGVELAQVDFLPSSTANEASAGKATPYLDVVGEASSIFSPGGTLEQSARTRVKGIDELVPVTGITNLRKSAEAPILPRVRAKDAAVAARLAELIAPQKHNPCAPLPSDKVRQIVFGLPKEDSGSSFFGLGYREVQKDQPLAPPAGAFDIQMFDHSAPHTVCLPLGKHGKPVKERWELVNVAGEDHNFHIHQSRFAVIAIQQPGSTGKPTALNRVVVAGRAVLHDNTPLPSGLGCDGTIKSWKQGSCQPSRVIVEITFSEVGDFVFHCHILEHEDGGMMAKISVVPPPL
jgi:FtsP/CotA-like multicopper oxidase with cupredoxin domain